MRVRVRVVVGVRVRVRVTKRRVVEAVEVANLVALLYVERRPTARRSKK